MPLARPALICAALLLAGCMRPGPSLDAELGELMQALPGSYAGMVPKALAADGEMERLVHSFVPIEVPQFGPKVLYYQIASGTADGKVLQAKIFVFSADKGRKANTMRAYILDPAQAGETLYADPARLAALNPSALMSFPQACFFRWSRVGGGFAGEGSPTCAYPSRAFGQMIRPEMSYRILGNRFEWGEVLRGEDGGAIVSTNGTLTALRQKAM